MMGRVRLVLRDVGPWTSGLLVCVWAILIWVVLRPPVADYGIHVSVAERLIAGDRLYAEVWDNKDPLYYLTLAFSRWLTPWGGWLIEVVRLLLVGVASYSLARAMGASRRVAALAGWIGVPVVVLGVADPTAGVLPGTALALLSMAALMRGRYAVAGALIAFVPLFKITVFPVALAAFLTALVLSGGLRQGRVWWRLGFGYALATVAVLLLLALRGELGPYLESLWLNFAYSQEGQEGGLAGLLAHLSPLQSQSVQVTVIASVLALALVRAQASSRADWVRGGQARTLWWSAVWSLAAVVGVLALTGKWPGHAKILIIPAALALIVVCTAGPRSLRRYAGAPTIAVLVIVLLLAGVPPVRGYLTSLEYGRANLNLQGTVSAHAELVLATGPAASYARVGQGDDPAHATGLRDWNLACPRFQQYWWESPATLQRTLDCLPSADVILVTPDLYGPVTSDAWGAFQLDVERILSTGYDCEETNGVRICVRRGTA